MTLFHNQRINQIVALAVILVLAGVFRFATLSQRGLIYWDEAKFALEGVRFHAYMQSWFGSAALDAGKTVGTAKPTHALLIALAFLMFGVHTFTPLFLNAFTSVVGVGVVFLIGRRLFGPWAGLLGALFLAVSEYDVIYARSALSESDANLLFLLAVFLWVLDWERISAWSPHARPGFPSGSLETRAPPIPITGRLVFSGLLAGAAFTTNYRLGVYVVALVLFDLGWNLREHGIGSATRRFGVWVTTSAALPLLWQLIDGVARLTGHVLFRSEVNIVVQSGTRVVFKSAQQNQPELYLQQALFQLHGSKGTSALHFDPRIYLQWFVVREGWIIPILFLLGLALALRFRQFAWLSLVSLSLLPYAVYVFAPYVVPRNLAAAVPFVCLLAAAGLVAVLERLSRDDLRRAALVVTGVAVAAYGGFLTWRLTGEQSGFVKAAQYVQSHGGKGLVSNEVMVWYLPGPSTGPGCDAPGIPGTRAGLAADLAAGFRYAEIETIDHGMADWIAAHAKRVGGPWPVWGNIRIDENPVGTENGYPPRQRSESVSVYDLKSLSLPPPGNEKVTACLRNVPI